MPDHSSCDLDLRSWLLTIDDRDERAWHIIDFGLMHDPAYADVVASAATGPGMHSRRLSAMIVPADELLHEQNPWRSVLPSLPAEPYRSRSISPQVQMKTNPFYRSER
ncbi:hypothetical protein ACVINW_001435 [Bradyrhizobium sp. USDA 4461]